MRDAYKETMKFYKNAGDADASDPPQREYFMASDVTIEKLSLMFTTSPKGIFYERNEFAGWFNSFTQYKKGGGDCSHWLSLYDNGVIRNYRKDPTSPDVEVDRAFIAMLGGTQPGILTRLLSNESYLESSLAARIMWVYPPKHCPRQTDCQVSEATELGYNGVLRRIRDIPFRDDATPNIIHLVPRRGSSLTRSAMNTQNEATGSTMAR